MTPKKNSWRIYQKRRDPVRRFRDKDKSKYHVFDNFKEILTEMAEEGKLDPVVGRERTNVCQILSRMKNNPLLIGEPELENLLLRGFSLRITKEKSRILFNSYLDLVSLVAEINRTV
jgi:ATP-dependent Clp protease ATP-binding subunit ClpC